MCPAHQRHATRPDPPLGWQQAAIADVRPMGWRSIPGWCTGDRHQGGTVAGQQEHEYVRSPRQV